MKSYRRNPHGSNETSALKTLHDEAVRYLREGLAPHVMRTKTYALRDKLKLNVPDSTLEELLLMVVEEVGLL